MTTIKIVLLIVICSAVAVWAIWPEQYVDCFPGLDEDESAELESLLDRGQWEALRPSEETRMKELIDKVDVKK